MEKELYTISAGQNYVNRWNDDNEGNSLKNHRYIRCRFTNVLFLKEEFSKILFEECSFINCIFKECSISDEACFWFVKSTLSKTIIDRCSFNYIRINDCNLYGVRFFNTSLRGCKMCRNNYRDVQFVDNCNLMDCIIMDFKGDMDIRFINNKSYTKLNYGSYIGRYVTGGSNKNRLDREQWLNLSYSYMDFGDQFLRNHVGGKYGICFYESKSAFHRTLRGWRKFASSVAAIVCGYGEKPVRSIMVSFFIITIFAFFYAVTGINTVVGILNISNIAGSFNCRESMNLIVYSLYFSIVTFSTLGYGDIVPTGIIGYILVIIEIILGVTMMGVWTSTLVRKLTR